MEREPLLRQGMGFDAKLHSNEYGLRLAISFFAENEEWVSELSSYAFTMSPTVDAHVESSCKAEPAASTGVT